MTGDKDWIIKVVISIVCMLLGISIVFLYKLFVFIGLI